MIVNGARPAVAVKVILGVSVVVDNFVFICFSVSVDELEKEDNISVFFTRLILTEPKDFKLAISTNFFLCN